MIAMLAGEAKLAAQDEADRERLAEQIARDGKRSPRGGRERTRVAVHRMKPDDLALLSMTQLTYIAAAVAAEMRRRR